MKDALAKTWAKIEREAFFCTSTAPSVAPEPFTLAKLESAMELREKLARNAPPPMPRIVESVYCSDAVEDWSEVRSPSRAKRRRRMGHRQRIKIARIPWKHATHLPNGYLVMHPVTAQYFRAELKARATA